MTIIMGVLILAFALWGVGDYFTQSSNDTLATVNGETIKYSAFATQFNRQIKSQAAQFGEGFDVTLLDSPMQRRSFLETMIQRQLLIQAANESGFAVISSKMETGHNDILSCTLGKVIKIMLQPHNKRTPKATGVARARMMIQSNLWWVTGFPALGLVVTVLALNLLSDELVVLRHACDVA